MATAPVMPPNWFKQTWPETALSAWRSKRLFALVLLTVAVVVGAHLRFHRLTLADMNGDEGFSWAEATAPSLLAVIKAQQNLDPGKLAFYEILLHGWIRVFGDSLFAMRALSAALGTISIVLLFVAVREVCLCLADEPNEGTAELAGAFAAFVMATNVRMVLSSRLVRMYPLMLACALVQIVFLVRAQRKGGLFDYAGLAIFTALMVAANFSAAFLLVAEALWMGALLLGKWTGARAGKLAIFRPGFAVLGGFGLLVAITLTGAGSSGARAVAAGTYSWIKLQPVTWPYKVLRDSTGNQKLFGILVALGVFGLWRQWRTARLVPGFLALWMMGPVLTAFAVTYLLLPLEFYRYVFIAFAGMFAFAGLGAASVPTTTLRIALAVLLIHLALHPTRFALKHPYQASWQKAVAVAAEQSSPDGRIGVFPDYCDNVVRFYLAPARRRDVRGVTGCAAPANVLLLTGRGIESDAKIAALDKCYPHLVKRLFLVEVRSR